MNNRPLISFVIPCYNSQDYMEHCISSLIPCGNECEILIVDDGSKDRTGEIADEWERKHPGIVKAVHLENKGHGGVINTGMSLAKGIWFKVVDSDDWLNEEPLQQLMDLLRGFVKDNTLTDLVITNFIYAKKGRKHQKVMQMTGSIPEGRIFTWDEFTLKRPDRYMLMHSLLYRTDVLRSSGRVLPEHVFYEDNIFAYQYLPYVKTLYYLDVNLYSYFIGREDQSVQESIMIKRIDQQIRITEIMIDAWHLSTAPETRNENLHRYMVNDLAMIMTITSVLLIRMHSDEALERKKKLWEYLRETDAATYDEMIEKNVMGRPVSSENPVVLKMDELTYSLSQKLFGFN